MPGPPYSRNDDTPNHPSSILYNIKTRREKSNLKDIQPDTDDNFIFININYSANL
jgi:hypothetical protein